MCIGLAVTVMMKMKLRSCQLCIENCTLSIFSYICVCHLRSLVKRVLVCGKASDVSIFFHLSYILTGLNINGAVWHVAGCCICSVLLLLLKVNHGLALCYFREGVLQLELGFLSAEKRAAWEMAFTDAKNKLCKLCVSGCCITVGWAHFIFPFSVSLLACVC